MAEHTFSFRKAVLVKGITGFDGSIVDQWAKPSQQSGQVYLYNENPDKVREASQRDVIKKRWTKDKIKSKVTHQTRKVLDDHR